MWPIDELHDLNLVLQAISLAGLDLKDFSNPLNDISQLEPGRKAFALKKLITSFQESFNVIEKVCHLLMFSLNFFKLKYLLQFSQVFKTSDWSNPWCMHRRSCRSYLRL